MLEYCEPEEPTELGKLHKRQYLSPLHLGPGDSLAGKVPGRLSPVLCPTSVGTLKWSKMTIPWWGTMW